MAGFDFGDFNKTYIWIAIAIILIIVLVYYFSKNDSIEPLLDELRKLQKKYISK